MRILLAVASWHPDHGGPYFSVGSLASELACRDHNEVHLLSAGYPSRPCWPAPKGTTFSEINGLRIPVVNQTWFRGSKQIFQAKISAISPTIIHDNGIWTSFNHHIAQSARILKIPKIVSLRGTFEPWAMNYRRWKKRLAWHLFQRNDLYSAACFHATAFREYEHIRNQGFHNPVAIISNGVQLASKPATFTVTPRIALVLGRIHPMKNLVTLVRAWNRIRPQGWCLKIVGNALGDYKKRVEDEIRYLKLNDIVNVESPVYYDDKMDLIANSQLCLLVSEGENFGVAIAEGLAAGIPAIASTQTPWESLRQQGAGWWTNNDEESLALTLKDATSRSPTDLKRMGESGRKLIERNYSIHQIADQFELLYQWLICKGERPNWIKLD